MLVGERACQLFVLAAWLWAWSICHAQARPQLPNGSSVPSLGRPYINTSLSPLPTSGSCGKCGIEAPGGIRLVYWEPDSVTKNGSNITFAQSYIQAYTQVDNGFTYTSPSVYVVYSSLRATATCSDSALHTIGPSFSQKTIAYSSRFLAYGTLSMPDAGCSEHVVVDGFHTIDFSSLYYNPITTTTTYKAGCAPYVNPRLSLPAELTNVDPSWQSCEPLFYGAFDPPSILTKISGGLVPSPVGAGQVTNAASAPAITDHVPTAQPVVTPAPPVTTPTNNAPANNAVPPANPLPASPDAPAANPLPASLPSANPPLANPSLANPTLANPPLANPAKTEAPSNYQSTSPASSPPSLGDLINRPFTSNTDNGVANPASGANPAAVAANPDRPAASPALVAIPVDAGDGKPAYAVVAAEPSPGGNPGSVAAVPFIGASSNQHAPASNSQGGPGAGNSAAAIAGNNAGGSSPVYPGGSSSPGSNPGGSSSVATPGGSTSDEPGNVAGPGARNGPAGTTKVTLNDGTTADIPTADIIEPAQPSGGNVAAGVLPSNFQTIHLSAGAFVAVPRASGSSSSVMVQGGDYLIPKPTASVAQQTLTLQDGHMTTVPIDQSQSITLQGGQVTKIAANAPPQALTLQNGQISTILPVPQTIVTLANGQVTTVPVAASIVGSGGDSLDVPQQIFTLAGGKVTTVPIDMPEETAVLLGGKVTTIPANAPSQVVTLANGQVSSISATPHMTVTLANGKATVIPVSNNTRLGTQDSGFIDVPDATISGKVHYTHVPIIKIQTATLNGTGSDSNGSAAAQSGLSSSPSPSTQPTIPTTPLGSLATPGASATAGKTSNGNRLWLRSKRLWGLLPLALLCCWNIA